MTVLFLWSNANVLDWEDGFGCRFDQFRDAAVGKSFIACVCVSLFFYVSHAGRICTSHIHIQPRQIFLEFSKGSEGIQMFTVQRLHLKNTHGIKRWLRLVISRPKIKKKKNFLKICEELSLMQLQQHLCYLEGWGMGAETTGGRGGCQG